MQQENSIYLEINKVVSILAKEGNQGNPFLQRFTEEDGSILFNLHLGGNGDTRSNKEERIISLQTA